MFLCKHENYRSCDPFADVNTTFHFPKARKIHHTFIQLVKDFSKVASKRTIQKPIFSGHILQQLIYHMSKKNLMEYPHIGVGEMLTRIVFYEMGQID